jgi:serine phosphatase RsbU (regulator of sigma subunit)
MEEDLEAARELQRILLPDAAPEIAGLKPPCAASAPADLERYHDIFEQRDGQTVIAMGDVSGKGAPPPRSTAG